MTPYLDGGFLLTLLVKTSGSPIANRLLQGHAPFALNFLHQLQAENLLISLQRGETPGRQMAGREGMRPRQTTRASDALPARRKQNPARQIIVAWATIMGGLGSFVATSNDAQAQPQQPAAARSDGRPDTRNDNSWTNDMVWIRGGAFWMGSTGGNPDEEPVHEVTVNGFWMDKTEVTNDQFEKFARATGYVTMAERKPDSKDFPGASPEMLVPGSVVFQPPAHAVSLDNHYLWWKWMPGANWRHPEGPGSDIKGREKHPVVHVCWFDAAAYAKWTGKRLPTEAEWECASRGGLDRKPYVWGEEQTPNGKWRANIWQGRFPGENSEADGFRGTAPVASFAPNGYGLYDMAGNVWEWCNDWYRPDSYAHSPTKNPQGPPESFDPNEPGVPKKVLRGGSYLCSDVYCTGYRPSARMKSSPDTGLSHTGFRCVRDGEEKKLQTPDSKHQRNSKSQAPER